LNYPSTGNARSYASADLVKDDPERGVVRPIYSTGYPTGKRGSASLIRQATSQNRMESKGGFS